jgi:hypothetical protein
VPPPGLLTYGRFDLAGSRTVASLYAGVPDAYRGVADWRKLISDAGYDVINLDLEGNPPVRLADRRERQDRWLLRPLVSGVGASGLIAPGGSWKSMVALAAAAAVASGSAHWIGWKPTRTGPVLYLDWEADADTHAERLAALAGSEPAPPDLWYTEERQPLRRSADVLAKRVGELGAVMVVVDSVMLARGGDAFSPESTIGFFAALRQIGVPALLVDHKSRTAVRKGWEGAFGSVVNDNMRRLTWEITTVADDDDGVWLSLEQGKSNNVGRMRPIALRVDVALDGEALKAVTVRQTDPRRIVHLVEKLPVAARVESALNETEEALTVAALAEAVGASEATVRGALSRMAGVRNIAAAGAQGRWKLDEDRRLVDPWV